MKKIIIALMLAGLAYGSANAQANSKFAKNYRVCKNSKGNYICSEHPNWTNDTYSGKKTMASEKKNPCDDLLATPNGMNKVSSYTGYYPQQGYRQHNIIVTYDYGRAPYEGLPSPQYDGPQKNEQRNLNYNQNSIDLPPSNGVFSK